MKGARGDVLRYCVLGVSGIALAAYLGLMLWHNAQNYVTPLQRFIAAHGDYEQLRQYTLQAKAAGEIRNRLPPDACVTTSFPADQVTLDAIIVKYYLYPLKVTDNWPNLFNHTPHSCRGHYYIDFHGKFASPDKAPPDFKTVHEAKVFALDKASVFLDDKAPPYPKFRILFGFILFNLWVLVTGVLACHVLSVRDRFAGTAGFFSAAYLLGFIVITLVLWLLLLAGFYLNYALVAVLLGSLFVQWMNRGPARPTRVSPSGRGDSLASDRGTPVAGKRSAAEWSMKLAVWLVMIIFVLNIIAIPVNVWDEMHIWLLKSKMFFATKTLAFDYTVDTNNYYPVLWSLNIAAQYFIAGGMYDEVAKWTSAAVFVAYLGVLFELALTLGLSRKLAWFALLIYLVGFPHWTMFTALTENIYLALICLALIFAMHYFVARATSCGIFLWTALLGVSTVKYEGSSISLFLVVAFLLSGRGRSRAEMAGEIKLAAPFLLLLVIPGLWQWWLKMHGIPFSIYHFQSGFSWEKLVLILKMSGATVFSGFNLLMTGVIFVPMMILGREKIWSRPERFLLLFCGLLTLFSLAAGLCWPKGELIPYYPEVLTRLFSRATPLLILFWASRSLGQTERAS